MTDLSASLSQSAGTPRKPSQPGLRLTPRPGGQNKDPAQTPQPQKSVLIRARAEHTDRQHWAAAAPRGPGSCGHPEATSRSPLGAIGSLTTTPIRSVSSVQGPLGVSQLANSAKSISVAKETSQSCSRGGGTAERGGQQGADEGSGCGGRAGTSCPGAATRRR